MSRASVQHLLSKWRIVPDREQGQHFLVDDTILQRIVATAQLSTSDRVLEVGPGIATLTTLLAEKAGRVAAVEIDPQFKPLLEAFTAVNTNTALLYADILKTPFEALQRALDIPDDGAYKIVANIPYYLTSRFFATILQYPVMPQMVVVLIQKEVAERIMAQVGDHTKLSLSIQFYAKPSIAFQVPRTAFNPVPEVDSAVLKLEQIHRWEYPVSERKTWQLITFGFSSKRKKLVNNLMAGLQIDRAKAAALLSEAGLDESIRAEAVSLEGWLALTKVVFPQS